MNRKLEDTNLISRPIFGFMQMKHDT